MPIPFYFGSLSCVITVMSGVVCECLALPRRFCLHFQIVVETGGGGTRHTHTHTDTQQAPCGLPQARRSQLGFPCRARISCMHIELYTVIDSADPSIHSFIDTDGWWSACVNGRQRCRCSSITLHCVWALHNIFSANFCIFFFFCSFFHCSWTWKNGSYLLERCVDCVTALSRSVVDRHPAPVDKHIFASCVNC